MSTMQPIRQSELCYLIMAMNVYRDAKSQSAAVVCGMMPSPGGTGKWDPAGSNG